MMVLCLKPLLCNGVRDCAHPSQVLKSLRLVQQGPRIKLGGRQSRAGSGPHCGTGNGCNSGEGRIAVDGGRAEWSQTERAAKDELWSEEVPLAAPISNPCELEDDD